MLEKLLGLLCEQCARLPDFRQPSPNLKYSMSDAALSAFAVFFMQSCSSQRHFEQWRETCMLWV